MGERSWNMMIATSMWPNVVGTKTSKTFIKREEVFQCFKFVERYLLSIVGNHKMLRYKIFVEFRLQVVNLQ